VAVLVHYLDPLAVRPEGVTGADRRNVHVFGVPFNRHKLLQDFSQFISTFQKVGFINRGITNEAFQTRFGIEQSTESSSKLRRTALSTVITESIFNSNLIRFASHLFSPRHFSSGSKLGR
jgi:hypothetical protein